MLCMLVTLNNAIWLARYRITLSSILATCAETPVRQSSPDYLTLFLAGVSRIVQALTCLSCTVIYLTQSPHKFNNCSGHLGLISS